MHDQYLIKGQNITLPDEIEQVDVLITWEDSTFGIDASALLLGADKKVGSDEDFVFYNQQESTDGSVRYLGRRETESGPHERLLVHLSAVPAEVDAIVLAGSVDTGSFGDLGKLSLHLMDASGSPIAEYVTADASTETAFVFGEIYRRNGLWKLRAIGQGWSSGLAGLAEDFGVEVGEDNATDGTYIDTDESITAAIEIDDDPTAPPIPAVPPIVVEAATAEEPAVHEPATPPVPATPATPASKPSRPRGVRTAKPVPKKAPLPEFKLAEADTWQPARLFSVIGVGSGEEQERRTTSALVSTMQAVPLFARAITSRAGAPAGSFEGYLEVPYTRGESRVIPDAVWKVSRGARLWTGLLEVKTGAGKHSREQLENYLDIAKKNKYDVVISLSNDLPAGAGELPVEVDKRKLSKVALRHLSWAEVIHEARMVLSHGGIDNPLQAWILHEFLRYIEHPKSGASEFVDMGRHWVAIRDAISAGTLRSGDPKAASIADSWIALARNLALRFTAELGVSVKHVLPRRAVNDAGYRTELTVEELANDGTFSAVLRIPDAAGELKVIADMRTNKVTCSTVVKAPDEGTAGKRVTWVLRQLKNAPSDLLIEATFTGPTSSTCEPHADIRAAPRILTDSQSGQLNSFSLMQTFTLGGKRAGTAASFIGSVTQSAESFYAEVIQPLREWVPAAPKGSDLQREEQADDEEL
ncbi:TerD family protein [Rhodococcus qingshengii]|uniref:TerD family protein n=1 Tax=Rhodococcus qingshengii TaxID=334542 RepID=UPI001F139D9B|nr:TerD family protein [Rhodococcus qingshengii]MDJ0441635.1 TerD family protein [Rhodococcus qingshengii]ULD45164.1 TerD family protein [Rhodococcus qingshengii]